MSGMLRRRSAGRGAARRLGSSPRRMRRPAGMTLVEVIVSLTLLAGVALGMESFLFRFSHSAATRSSKDAATELAEQRLADIQRATSYGNLETTFAGNESALAGYPGFNRVTAVKHVGGGSTDPADYKIVTVTVTAPDTTVRASKTTAIASF